MTRKHRKIQLSSCSETHWQEKIINISGVRVNHMRFADDIVLIADNIQDVTSMIHVLKTLSSFRKRSIRDKLEN